MSAQRTSVIMPPIEFLNVASAPSPYSNHILIERTRSGTYRYEGVSTHLARGKATTTSPHFHDLAAAKLAAEEWARENDVRVIYVMI